MVDASSPQSLFHGGPPDAAKLATIGSYPTPLLAWALHYYASESDKAQLFHADISASVASSLRFLESGVQARTPAGFIDHDLGFYFPNEMLTKVDRMCMAHAVESRAPFAAAPLLHLGPQIPFALKYRADTTKWLLRQAFADILPAEVVMRPKHGFNVPIDRWLKGPWHELFADAFLSKDHSELWKHGILRPGADKTAQAMLDNSTRLNGHTLLCFIALNMWLSQE